VENACNYCNPRGKTPRNASGGQEVEILTEIQEVLERGRDSERAFARLAEAREALALTRSQEQHLWQMVFAAGLLAEWAGAKRVQELARAASGLVGADLDALPSGRW